MQTEWPLKNHFIIGAYFSFDLKWRSGELCKVAGALSVLSSEVSVLMLTVITADRLISIVFAFSCSRLTLKGTYVICTVVWICGTVIAVVPAFDTPYFYNVDRRYGFYGIMSYWLNLTSIKFDRDKFKRVLNLAFFAKLAKISNR